ncbi:MAG: hypothetical protein ACK2TZ_05890 [Anaerolineales bacterium]
MSADKFYLGRIYDSAKSEVTEENLLYDPDDLTTHAVCVGMTGSGKTGLCIDLLEEAALQGIPALMIDPKGDITNALLHFPELKASDFAPWVNPDQARREDKTIEQAAADAAALWKNGLAKWDIGPERIQALQDSAHFAVYTPGSEAGIPVNILASLKAPDLTWAENREILVERISGIVMGLLGLVGLDDIDPVRSREHILLSNIFEHAWSQGKDLDLTELILQIQTPPFDKLGVLDLDNFFPEKDRMELSILLNSILAAPTFQSWIEGEPLDVENYLYGPDGRPRHSVFYIAHLSDQERMFFVTLLYAAVETWMRKQKGSTTLRALMYFDEIFGYLPPVKNPPSKTPMLRMLKQARAFGVGQVLVTQNPVDVDYKALSNAGTWFIGKLQTEQDKNRLLDGLEGAAPGLDRKVYDKLISTLDKRVFLLHNVHEDQPVTFYTRWAMNYLTGPLTRVQLPALNALAGAAQGLSASTGAAAKPPARKTSAGSSELTKTRPKVPAGIDEYFLPNKLSLQQAVDAAGISAPQDVPYQVVYKPVLVAQASVRFLRRNYNLDHDLKTAALVRELDRTGRVGWEDWTSEPIDLDALEADPRPEARFFDITGPFSDGSKLRELETDFTDWIYHSVTVNVRSNEELEIFAGPQISQGDFRRMCSQAAEGALEAEKDKIESSFEKKMDVIKDRLMREERELGEDETRLSQRKMEEVGTLADNLIGLLAGRSRRLTTSLTKRRMTSQAKAAVEESLQSIEQYKKEIEDLQREREDALADVEQKWQEILENTVDIPVAPYKKDILMELFGVAWMPYYSYEQDGRKIELGAYS